jgi:hypothetical protein
MIDDRRIDSTFDVFAAFVLRIFTILARIEYAIYHDWLS